MFALLLYISDIENRHSLNGASPAKPLEQDVLFNCEPEAQIKSQGHGQNKMFMKKLSTFLLALVACIGTISAQEVKNLFEVNGIWYTLIEISGNVNAWVTYHGWSPSEYKEYSGHVDVPATVSYYDNTYDVVGIYDHAFDGNDGLTSVTLPESITHIGWGSFKNCTGLTSMVLPDNVEFIEPEAFLGCTGLKSITLGTGLKDVNYLAFKDCSALEKVTCKAPTPPVLVYYAEWPEEGDGEVQFIPNFANVDCSQIPLYVPAASVPLYYRAEQWKDFKFIKAYDAATIVIDDEEATAIAAESSVDIAWPAVDNAVAYIIEIRHNNELICSMTFNAEGIILSATYAAPARNRTDNKAPAAVQTTNGWKYTIDGLEANSEYEYTVTAKNSEDGVIYTKTASFTTQASEDLESVQPSNVRSQKIIRNGQLVIERDGKTFNATGAQIK